MGIEEILLVSSSLLILLLGIFLVHPEASKQANKQTKTKKSNQNNNTKNKP
jgi:hypothetical protein